MADNTVADLPKKNAAPAEPAKSLQATVQQVMSKAVTSPTDAKVDFAQGVNHITGDPQQKSAGAADAMQSLKAEADPKKSYSNANEADEKKDEKEKEEVKEVADKEDEKKKDEMMKASKDKEDMKEGEMPAGLKKYLDKKNGKEEEADKEKKDVKEVAELYEAKFLNFEKIVPNQEWGLKQSTQFNSKLEKDYMHFTETGHEILANKLIESLNSK